MKNKRKIQAQNQEIGQVQITLRINVGKPIQEPAILHKAYEWLAFHAYSQHVGGIVFPQLTLENKDHGDVQTHVD